MINKLFMLKDIRFIFNNKDLLFVISYVLFLVVTIARQSFLGIMLKLNNDLIFKLILLMCLFLLMLKEYIVCEFRYTYLIGLIIILGLTFLIKSVAAFTSSASLFFLFASRDTDKKTILKVSLYVSLIMLLTIILLSLVGIIENYQFGLQSDRPREFLGFKYALFAPALLFNIVALVIYIYKEKLNWIIIALLMIINQWMFIKTDSRLSYYLIVFLLIIALIIKVDVSTFIHNKIKIVRNFFKFIIKYGFIFSYVICAIVSCVINVNYNHDNDFEKKMNEILANRLQSGADAYDEYGIKLFGQRINWVGNGLDVNGEVSEKEHIYVDNLYLRFLMQYGVLFFLIVIFCLTYSMKEIWAESDYLLLIILGVIAIHAMLDDLVLYLWYNSFLLVFPPYIFKKRIIKKAIV